MDELISSSYQITLWKDSSYQTEFESAVDGPLKTAWKTKFVDKDLSLQSDLHAMVGLVMTGKYAMYDSLPAIRTLEEFKECKIANVGFSTTKLDLAFALQKNSPFKEPLNRALGKMFENGEIDRFRKKNQDQLPECEEKGKGKPIGMGNVVFPIGIYIIGVGGALLGFFGEFVLKVFTNTLKEVNIHYLYQQLIHCPKYW